MNTYIWWHMTIYNEQRHSKDFLQLALGHCPVSCAVGVCEVLGASSKSPHLQLLATRYRGLHAHGAGQLLYIMYTNIAYAWEIHTYV